MRKFQMNVFSVTAMGIGAMVGAGIFALLGQIILQASSLTYVSFLISGLAAMFCGYSYSKLAGYIPKSGGITDYYQAAFPSKIVSGGLSLIYLFTLMVSIAMLSKSFAIYALGVINISNPSSLEIDLIALILISSLTLLNMQNSGDVGKAELLLVATKLVILIALIIGIGFNPQLEYDNIPHAPSTFSFLGSIGITFFAYAGFGTMVNSAQSVANPNVTITRAIYIAIGLVIALYLSLAHIVLNYIPQAEIINGADTAVATVASKLWGTSGKYLLSFAALIAFISGINAMFFSSYNIISALASQKVFPQIINYKLTKTGTLGGLLCSVVILGAIIMFNFKAVINLSSGAFLLSYLAVLLANWKIRKETSSSSIGIAIGIFLMLFICISFFISLIE